MPSSYTCLYYHIIFSTKHRRPQITPDLRARLYPYVAGIITNQKGHLLAIGGMPDHVHLLVSLPAHTSVSAALRLVKSNSSKWVHETFASRRDFAWQDGYAAFSVSASNRDAVRRYIAAQDGHHRRVSFQDELVDFLKRHEIAYDERYIWA